MKKIAVIGNGKLFSSILLSKLEIIDNWTGELIPIKLPPKVEETPFIPKKSKHCYSEVQKRNSFFNKKKG